MRVNINIVITRLPQLGKWKAEYRGGSVRMKGLWVSYFLSVEFRKVLTLLPQMKLGLQWA